ncbi:MAG: hypothetical protein LGL72_17770 [Acidibrevibacterium sp.]|uniref:hypothetical protein n=1 Tax=Acidibrevibacterium fodinaquatile TaxID=1969806 RepID=UPI0023A8593E|nr:hypothetical protein [Acidibrevibacterium fodinaquatile]MCA7121195.1 hypothetical protein [Acidibrevibacterium fodinaquatile]
MEISKFSLPLNGLRNNFHATLGRARNRVAKSRHEQRHDLFIAVHKNPLTASIDRFISALLQCSKAGVAGWSGSAEQAGAGAKKAADVVKMAPGQRACRK